MAWIRRYVFWTSVLDHYNCSGYLLIKQLIEQNKSRGEEKSALDVAKERYAKGEITKEEFEEMKKHLI